MKKLKLIAFTILVIISANTFAQPAYVYHDKGVALFTAGKYEEAIKEFDNAIKKDANDFESFTDRGRCYAALNKSDLAIADFSQAIKLNPGYQQAYYYRGMANASVNKDQQALADYGKVIALVPDFVDGYVKRGLLYYKMGQTDNALKDLNKGIDLKAGNAEVFFARAEIYRNTGKDDLAIKDYTSALQSDPKHVNAYYNRGVLFEKKKRYQDAVNDYSKAIELDMKTEDIFLKRAACNIAMGKKDEAVKDYTTLIDVIKTKNADVYVGRGIAFNQKGDHLNAVKDLSKALTLKKDDAAALTERGYAYLKQGKSKYALATNDFNKAISIDPGNFVAYSGLGKISFESNKFGQGVVQLTEALKIKPDADAHYMRSKCYYKLDNKKAACDDLQKAANMGHADAKRDFKEVCGGM